MQLQQLEQRQLVVSSDASGGLKVWHLLKKCTLYAICAEAVPQLVPLSDSTFVFHNKQQLIRINYRYDEKKVEELIKEAERASDLEEAKELEKLSQVASRNCTLLNSFYEIDELVNGSNYTETSSRPKSERKIFSNPSDFIIDISPINLPHTQAIRQIAFVAQQSILLVMGSSGSESFVDLLDSKSLIVISRILENLGAAPIFFLIDLPQPDGQALQS